MNDYKPTLVQRVLPPDEKNGYQVIELDGDMDKAGLSIVKDDLEKISDDFAYKYLVFDFTDLNYINSEGIGFFMALHSHLVKMKKVLVFTSARDNVKDVLSVIGILSVVEYHDTLEEFKKKIA
jgi:anti-anti-sigma factor